jgi:hypothetical protein
MSAQRNARLRQFLVALGLSSALLTQPVRADEPETEGTLHLTAKSVTVITRDVVPGAFDTTERQIPTMQMLNLRGENLSGTGMFAYGSGFAAQQIASGSLPPSRAADLAYGYVGWDGVDHKVRIQVGRQFVFSGAPRYIFMDGASAIMRLPMNLRLDVYGGTAAFSSFEHAFDAPVVGTRLAWMPWTRGHIAAAFQDVSGSTEATRRTIGTDASLRLGKVTFTGLYAYDLLGRGMQEARIDGTWRPVPWLGLFARGEARDPLAYLPRNSIFTAFVQRTDGLVGLGFDVKTPGALYGSGSYDRYIISDGHLDGYRAQLNVGLRLDEKGLYRTGLTYNRMYNGDNGYDQYRVWCRGQLPGNFTAAVDLDSYFFLTPVRGVSQSLMATVALRYLPTPGLTAGLDGQVWTNPYFTSQAMALVSLTVTDTLFRPAPVAAAPPAKKADDDEGRGALPIAPGLALNDRPLVGGAL